MDNNFNIDKNTMDKLNSIMKNGDVSKLISQISPDMMENFSSIMNNNKNDSNGNTNSNINDTTKSNTSNTNNNNSTNSFDFSNIDMNTIMKMKSVMEKLNSSNDPRSNLLNSLKPYLRNEKKEKLDQYSNLINFAKIAEIMKNDNKE